MAQEILISINVESGEAKARVNDLKKGTDNLSKSFGVLAKQSNKNKFEQASLRGEQKLATEQQKKLNYEMQNAGKIAAVYEMSTKKAGAGTKQFRTQVGLNNAILQEAGRAASDVRFGFNGVANNVGQLASLFGSLINTSDNVVTSLKNLGKSLLGTGGILIAVQLLIAYGDRIYKFFTDFATNAGILTEAFKDSAKQISSTVGNFEIYIRTLQSTNKSQKEQSDAIHQLNEEFPDFIQSLKESNISLLDIKNSTDEATLATELYRQSIKELALSEAARAKITELQSEALQIQIDRETRARENGFASYQDALIAAGEIQEESDQIIAKSGTSQSTYIDTVAENAKKIVGLRQDELDDIEKNTAILLDYVDIRIDADDKSGKSLSKRVRFFREGLLQLEKLEQSYRQKAIDQYLLTEEEKIENQRKADLKGLQITVDNFQARELIRLNAYVKEINGRKLADAKKQELIDKANLAFGQSIQKSEKDAADVIVQINANANTKLDKLERKRTENIKSQYDQQIEDARSLADEKKQLALLELTDPNSLTFSREQLDLTIKQTDAEKERIAALIVAADQNLLSMAIKLESEDLGEEERSALEVGFADALTNRAKLDSEYTKVSIKNSTDRRKIAQAEENARVQGFTVVGNAMTAFAKLAGEDTKAGKALAVSGALISTYLSAQKAFESQFKPLSTVDSPVRGTIAAAAAVASGLANVKAILAVDPSGTTSSGSSASVQAPNFNVVGTSSVDQLAQTVAGQTNEPIKAYVVGKDVTNQQELDRNIVNTAGI